MPGEAQTHFPATPQVEFLRPGQQDVLTILEGLYRAEGKEFLGPVDQFITPGKNLFDPQGGILYTGNGNRELARDYWLRLGIPQGEVDKMVDENGRIRQVVTGAFPRFMSPEAAANWVIETADGFYDHNPKPLAEGIKWDKQSIDGFNDHRKPHIYTVVNGALKVLHQRDSFRGDLVLDDYLEAAIGGGIHDMGNILNRQLHAKISPALAALRMPTLTADAAFWEKVRRVAIFHNEPEVREVIEKVWHTQGDAAATIKAMAQDFSPALIAVTLADKLHLGPDRLPDIWHLSEGFLRDWQIGINAAWKMRNYRYENDGKEFVIDIDYNAGLEDVGEYFGAVNERENRQTRRDADTRLRHSDVRGAKYDMPEAIHEHLKEGISHSQVLEAMFWADDGYKDRIRLAIMSAFALNPKTTTVEVNMWDQDHIDHLHTLKDKDTGERFFTDEQIEAIQHRSYTFTRDTIDTKIARIQQGFLESGVNMDRLRNARDSLRSQAAQQFAA